MTRSRLWRLTINFYKFNMKLFITGGCGFIGSHFIRYILENHLEDSVLNFDKLTYAGNLKNLEDVEKNFSSRYSFVKDDIADNSKVMAQVAAYKPDAVINFAAESHVDRSILDPEAFVRTNIVGVHSLLEAVRKLSIPRFLQVSTDEVYGEAHEGSFTENTPLAPRSPYAASKASGDILALSYFTTFGTPVVITRSANAYGTHQYPEKLIPLLITNLIEGKKIPVYGDGLHTRHWTHVLDHCSGINTALRKGEPGHVYNLASGEDKEYTNLDIARIILSEFGKDDSWIEWGRDRLGHDRRYRVNASKLASLGWKSRHELQNNIAHLVKWHRENESWWKPLKSGEHKAYYEKQYQTA
ncbi:MAG: putative dTDP-glucose 4,6-dehydratase [Parcubacteria group bacterium GW2011_GWA2_40_8]|nr:MAG: putative dTDP-glucose 4,6-dehydratase [Parcubacteria group bacterium GW2011_GWB1_40_14]KKR78808.1 MAG: putative dTDP-glucose 4,6-dehydratase [Parcubacteria group bacterium GW2011_GWA2_40_8]